MGNLLVTGGAGFIGANFVRYWRSAAPNDSIIVYDLLTYAGNSDNIAGLDGVELVIGDISDDRLVSKVISEREIDTIVHFAAESHVDRSISEPAAFIKTNIVGTFNLLKVAKSYWLDHGSGKPHRFHHVSTDEVFGSLGPDDEPFCETTAYAPNSPYAASKAGSDHLVSAYHRTYGLETTISNCSNNYGPYQFPEKLIPLFVLNALHGRSLPIYGDGLNVRDWLHVEDHCRGIELVLKKGRAGETYNIGGGQELPNIEVVEQICSSIDAAFAAEPLLQRRFPKAPPAQGRPTGALKSYVADRLGHDRRYAIEERKIRVELGYAPAHDFPSGLARTVNWYLDQEDWWRPLVSY